MLRLCAINLLFWLGAWHLQAQQFIGEEGEAVFLSKAPLNQFEGKSSALKGLIDLEKNLLDFYIDLNTLKTGIKLRDKHMRENYLETKKYPFAEFTGSIVTLLGEEKFTTAPKEVIAKGILKIHGVEKEMEIAGSINTTENGALKLNASFDISLEAFNIERPSVVFYELADKQEISIKITLEPKKEEE